MYKTIRHGENSLQYTILPQNDDIRMDGKLTSASSSNNNNNSISNLGTCQSIKRNSGKNKSFYAYLGLLFVCTVIIGAILIPFLVSAECLQNPSDWFLKTRVAFTGHINNNFNTTSTTISVPLFDINNNNIKNSNNNQSIDSTINKSYPNANNIELGLNDYIPTTITTTTINNTASIKHKKIKNNYNNNLIVNKQKILNKNNNDVYKNENDITESNDNDKIIKDENNQIEQTTKDSIISNAILISIQQNNKKQQQIQPKELIANNKFNSGIIHSTNIPLNIIMTTEASLSTESENAVIETTSEISTISSSNLTNTKLIPSSLPSISVTKKPIILAVLSKTNSVISENSIMIPKHNESKNWIKSHWPFIDPSTYFQWTGYKSEDSVILPAILGITLIGTIFTLTLCLVARNKRTIVASVRKRKRNHIDGTGEDNATLLTIANLSDADDE